VNKTSYFQPFVDLNTCRQKTFQTLDFVDFLAFFTGVFYAVMV